MVEGCIKGKDHDGKFVYVCKRACMCVSVRERENLNLFTEGTQPYEVTSHAENFNCLIMGISIE